MNKEVPKSRDRISLEQDIYFVKQLIDTLEEAELQLEKAYLEKDEKEFRELKQFMVSVQEEIGRVLNE